MTQDVFPGEPATGTGNRMIREMHKAARRPGGRFRVTPVAAIMILSAVCCLHRADAVAAPISRTPASSWADKMPEGEGKRIAVESCQFCHTLEKIVLAPRAKDDWKLTVEAMIKQGAPVSEEDIEILVEYLAANFGPPGSESRTPAADGTSTAR
jgi:mono/diheme cytochrome c family protein